MLIEKIKKVITDDFNAASELKGRRSKVISASAIGGECRRKLWYMFHDNPMQEKHDFQGAANMSSGIRAEALMLDFMKKCPGVKIIEEQATVEIENWSIHCDAIIEIEDKRFIWEHKETARKKFDTLIKNPSLIDWNPTYYAQVQTYMHFFKIENTLFTVSTEGVRDITEIIIPYDLIYSRDIIYKANSIINAERAENVARVSEKPDFYLCRFCQFSEKCHGPAFT